MFYLIIILSTCAAAIVTGVYSVLRDIDKQFKQPSKEEWKIFTED